MIAHSQLVEVVVSFRVRFSTMHVTVDSLEMLAVKWLVMLYRYESGSNVAWVSTEPSGGS